MELIAEDLEGTRVLEGLGMEVGGSGDDNIMLSLIVASRKMSGALQERQQRALRDEEPPPSSLAGTINAQETQVSHHRLSSASRWRSVRERILDTVRGNASNSNGLVANPASAALSTRNRPASLRGSMASALFALIELKKAHWVKGIYFIYDVVSDRSSEDGAKDSILASNLCRRIPYLRDSGSIPSKVLEDFEACSMAGNLDTGTWDSEDGRIISSLHNGGPVNWSQVGLNNSGHNFLRCI